MEKILLGGVLGIFVWVLAVKILCWEKPELVKKIENKIENKTEEIIDAFITALGKGRKVETSQKKSAQTDRSMA